MRASEHKMREVTPSGASDGRPEPGISLTEYPYVFYGSV